MSEIPNKEEKKVKYDPRIGYEFVPAFLIISMMSVKCLAYISPYFAALWLKDTNVGLVLSISSDDTFNMILATLIGYFIRDKVAGNQNKP